MIIEVVGLVAAAVVIVVVSLEIFPGKARLGGVGGGV